MLLLLLLLLPLQLPVARCCRYHRRRRRRLCCLCYCSSVLPPLQPPPPPPPLLSSYRHISSTSHCHPAPAPWFDPHPLPRRFTLAWMPSPHASTPSPPPPITAFPPRTSPPRSHCPRSRRSRPGTAGLSRDGARLSGGRPLLPMSNRDSGRAGLCGRACSWGAEVTAACRIRVGGWSYFKTLVAERCPHGAFRVEPMPSHAQWSSTHCAPLQRVQLMMAQLEGAAASPFSGSTAPS